MEIRVSTFEYETATAPDELYSGGIGPCIVMGAIYGKKGYMIHGHSINTNFGMFIEPIFTDLRKAIHKKNLGIYVIGGETARDEDPECVEEILHGRQTLLDKIKDEGLSPCLKLVRWNQPNYTQTLRLVLSKGKAITENLRRT